MATSGGVGIIPKVTARPSRHRLPRGYSHPTPGALTPVAMRGTGLFARLSPIKGITPERTLRHRIYLPAMLNTFTVDEQALHNEYDTLSGGHFSQPAQGPPHARQFRTTNIDSIIVAFDTPWLVVVGQDMNALRNALYEVLRARKPVHLLVGWHPRRDTPPEFSGYVTLRGLTKDVRPAENESRYLTLAISEWRDPQAGVRSSQPDGASRKHGVSLPATHALRATDTLASLSHEYYGRYDNWRYIRDANGIGKRFGQKTPLIDLPGRWKVGYKIKIPLVAGVKRGVGLAVNDPRVKAGQGLAT